MRFGNRLAVGVLVVGGWFLALGAERPLDLSKGRAYGNGFVPDGEEIVCANEAGKGRYGICWGYSPTGDGVDVFSFSAESKMETGAKQRASSDYSVYVDLTYRDGSHQYGLIAAFACDCTKGWQRKRVRVVPDKPVRSVGLTLVFRNMKGRVRFRKPTLTIEKSDGAALLDSRIVNEAELEAGRPVVGPYQVCTLETAGRPAVGPYPFKVYPISITNRLGGDRAMTYIYTLPFPKDAQVTWLGGVLKEEEEDVTNRRGQRCLSAPAGVGEGRLSKWPFAAVRVNGKGYALGIDPGAPVVFRAAYSAGLKMLYVACDVGFAPEHPTADFRLVSFEFPGAQGFRGALAAYQRVLPKYSAVRIRKHGVWMPFWNISKVEGWEDFGFAVKEGNAEPDWDKAHGILTFRYTEPMTWWMGMKNGANATLEECRAEANRQAAKGVKIAKAWQKAAWWDAEGTAVGDVLDRPWSKGALWFMCPLPGIAGGEYEAKVGAFEQKGDGEYIDSAQFRTAPRLDYRREHFAAAQTPLAYDPETRQVGVPQCLATYEYVRAASDRCHAIGRYLMGNGIPYTWPWLVAYSDYGGREVQWIDAAGNWKPETHENLMYFRAMSGGKPFCFLMNVNFEKFTHAMSEKYMQRCLAYGLFAGFFSHNASHRHYFSQPKLYNRDRDLFKKYVPICREISEAGWRPVNELVTTPEKERDVLVEQFGDRYVTVYNKTARARDVELKLAAGGTASRGRAALPVCSELVTGAAIAFSNGVARATIPEESVRVLKFALRATDEK